MRSLIFILTLVLYFSGSLRGQQLISPDDERITAGGVFFITRTPDKLVLKSFATNSKHIKVLMEPRRETSLRYGIFGNYKNGVLVNQIKVLPKNNDTFDGISFENPEGEAAEWKVLFPTYYGVDIKGIQIDEGSNFQATKKDNRPVYVAIGNSITQGTGQAASFQTYPFILSEKKDWQQRLYPKRRNNPEVYKTCEDAG